MKSNGEPVIIKHRKNVPVSYRRRAGLLLIAFCCLSVGTAIGAIATGMVSAVAEDNRLAINQSPALHDTLSAAFAHASKVVEPSVVNIRVHVGECYACEGVGSGVVVNQAGFIVTNRHVIARALKIRVKLANGNEYDAKVIGKDSGTDLAILKIEAGEPLAVARIGDSDNLKVGDWVLAIGSPFGLEQTVTAGIISAKDRVADPYSQTPFQQFLQTDAAINPGNSGGPLVNLAGEVVGINSQIATNSGFNNGIGLALPSSTIVEVYNQIAACGRVRRGFLGINPQELPPQVARLNKMTEGPGVLVRNLTSATGPAARAGLRSGDIITSINGQNVKDVRDLIRRAASLPVGSSATVAYVRNGETRTAEVILEERKEDEDEPDVIVFPFEPRELGSAQEPKNTNPKKPGLGIHVTTLAPGLAKKHGLEGAQGMYVTKVDPGSVAYDNGLRADDLIVEMNNMLVATRAEFQQVVSKLRSGDDLVIQVLRKERGARLGFIISFTIP